VIVEMGQKLGKSHLISEAEPFANGIFIVVNFDCCLTPSFTSFKKSSHSNLASF
jgi:hypothetical protein